jgi:hypothetical protein
MWRTMCDSDQLGPLVACDFVTTYADLMTSHDQVAALRARFPASTVLFIDRGLGDPLDVGTRADVEPGALTVAQVHDWAAGKLERGHRFVTHYSDQDELPAILAAVTGLDTWSWVADPGQLAVPGHPAVITQVLFAPPRGLHIDLSIVKNDAWHPGQGATGWLAPVLAGMLAADKSLSGAIAAVKAHKG